MKIGHIFLLAFGIVFGMFLVMLIIAGFTGGAGDADDSSASDTEAYDQPGEIVSDEYSQTCLHNLTELAIACHAYPTLDNRQLYPASLRALATAGFISNRQILSCPLDTVERDGWHTSYESAFDIIGREVSTDLIPGGFMMIWDSVPRHAGTRCVVLFNFDLVQMHEEDFQGALVQQRERMAELTAPPRTGTPVFNEEELETLLNLD